jgi:2-keto-3-deoxy-6-phosphogluconate aldolase
MSKKQEIIDRLKASGVVAVVRTDQPGALVEVARARAKGGVCFARGGSRLYGGYLPARIQC